MSDDKPRPDDETQPVRPAGAAAPPPEPAAAHAPTPAEAPEPAAAPAAEPAAAPAPVEADEPAPAARRGFRERLRDLRRRDGRDRAYGLAALIASALAGVIVGGLGLTAVHAITHDGPGDRFDRFDRFDRDARGGWVQRQDERGGPGFGGPSGGMHGGPPGVPGQVPPTTPPEEQDGSAS